MSKVWLQRREAVDDLCRDEAGNMCYFKGVDECNRPKGLGKVCFINKIFLQVVPKRLLRKKGCLNCEYNQPDLWCAKTKAFGPDCGYEPKQGYSLIGG